jgi:colanic acid biosynthesis glycosyl transferase WcaI
MKILLLNQCFYPDVVSTAQHLADLAVELSAQGHEVTVIASRRGYDAATVNFKSKETWKGVQVIRIPTLGLGKKAKWRRAADFASFIFFCLCKLLIVPGQDAVVALTSPPLISFIGALFTKIKGGRFYFWVMDLNPDEAIAAGWLKETSATSKALQAMLRYGLRRAEKVIVLDRFMKERVLAKGLKDERLVVIPPWSHDESVRFDSEGRKSFRAAHNLAGKYVVMYSGNHSPCHPLDTLLAAAAELRSDDRIAFCFVGGGSEYRKVQSFAAERRLENIVCLPYQPLEKLAASLSAADLSVVVMGEPFVGIVHPCKIYNILATGTPVLYVGPHESHATDILQRVDDKRYARTARQGDVEAVVRHILEGAGAAATTRDAQAAIKLSADYSRERLLPRMINVIETCGPYPAGQQVVPLAE